LFFIFQHTTLLLLLAIFYITLHHANGSALFNNPPASEDISFSIPENNLTVPQYGNEGIQPRKRDVDIDELNTLQNTGMLESESAETDLQTETDRSKRSPRAGN